MTTTYKIESVQTSYSVISTGDERSGKIVRSTKAKVPPHYTGLLFSYDVKQSQGTPVQIRGNAGFYIGYDLKSPDRLLWLTGEDPTTQWRVAKTGDAYRFYPNNGADLYWYLSDATEGYVGLAAGKDLTDNEPLFDLI
ncbi:hypothetical protein V8E55_002515 [Tylopilus felleus]|jgi:hypothetical protein